MIQEYFEFFSVQTHAHLLARLRAGNFIDLEFGVAVE